jgi:hypothetical protein
MGGSAFLITRDDYGLHDPAKARDTVRKGGAFESLRAAVAAAPDLVRVEPSMKTVTIAKDAVLMMIGNTQELLKSCAEAVSDGITFVETEDEEELSRYYARINVSPRQTDTLLMIGSVSSYWAGSTGLADGWKRPIGPAGNYTATKSVSLMDVDPAGERNTTRLPEVLRQIKAFDSKGWIKAY